MGKRRAETQAQAAAPLAGEGAPTPAAPIAPDTSPQGVPPPGASATPGPSAASAPGGMSSDAVERLKELAELHKQGVLTDEEFATQKARILS